MKNRYLDLYNKWHDHPLISRGGWIIIFIFYYLIVIGFLTNAVTNLQNTIETQKTDLLWMAKSIQKIKHLQQMTPFRQGKNQGTVFSAVNLTVNATGWKNLITDVRQINVDQVQVTFKTIAFTELLGWFEKLYQQQGVYVMQASLQKTQPGLVDATVILTKRPQTVRTND
jgi:type II secretory pathway component PulM